MRNIIVNNTEIKISRRTHLLILLILPVAFLILAFLFDTPAHILSGLYEIVLTPDTLLTDYLAIGGFGATLLNVSLIALINIFIIYKLNIQINGAVIAALFTLMGFSFFGKSIFNIWAMYLGGFIYVKYHKILFEQIIVVIMFSTCLAPIVSQFSFLQDCPCLTELF